MRLYQLLPCSLVAVCIFTGCAGDPPSEKTGDMGVTVDDLGSLVSDVRPSGTDTGTAVEGFPAPPFGGVAQLPLLVEHVAAHPDGWAVLGSPVAGAMVDGGALDGRFAVGVVDESGLVWAKSINPPDRDSDLGSVAADASGNVYVGLVSYSRAIDFGDGITETGDPDGRAQSGFVVKYDANGVTQWATGFWADSGLANTFVAARGEHVVAAGTYTIWDPLSYRGPGGIVVGPDFKRSSTRTAFVIPLDPATGAGQWHELYSSTSDGATLSDVEVLDDGSILAAGSFDNYDTGTMTNPAGDVYTDAAPGGYVARFAAVGGLSWFTVAGERLEVASDGTQVAVAGGYAEGSDVGEGAGIFVATVEPMTGALSGHATLAGQYAVLGLTYGEQVAALIAPPLDGTGAELDGMQVPANRFALAFDDEWNVSWLTAFPNNVTPTALASTADAFAVGGKFTGEHDFGDGTHSAASDDGFVVTLAP